MSWRFKKKLGMKLKTYHFSPNGAKINFTVRKRNDPILHLKKRLLNCYISISPNIAASLFKIKGIVRVVLKGLYA